MNIAEIAEITAKAKTFAASIPVGDDRRHLVPEINDICGGIDLALHILESPLHYSELMRAETTRALNVMVGQLRGPLLLARTFKLAQEMGRVRKRRKEINVPNSKEGGKATAAKFARPELDDLIRACLARGEKTSQYVKAWASDYNLSRQTIYNHINAIKKELRG